MVLFVVMGNKNLMIRRIKKIYYQAEGKLNDMTWQNREYHLYNIMIYYYMGISYFRTNWNTRGYEKYIQTNPSKDY